MRHEGNALELNMKEDMRPVLRRTCEHGHTVAQGLDKLHLLRGMIPRDQVLPNI
jgi:hypothetical protein